MRLTLVLVMGVGIGLGCYESGDRVRGGVSRFHDDASGATCWLYYQNAISCLPDSQLKDGGR